VLNKRNAKTTQLDLEHQKSNLTSNSNVSHVKGLMPRRIMSAARRNSQNKSLNLKKQASSEKIE
jgi:hypothetical protein